MNDLILHHFDASPFAEKIRIILGIKNATWQSVQIPMIMPKPDLTELTGGYRKTPTLQRGADIYCDTWLISDKLEDWLPQPSLFAPGERGRALALSRWSDKSFFEPGAALSMGENPAVPDVVIEDRKAFFNFMDFNKLDESLPESRRQFQAHLSLLDGDLTESGEFLSGAAPGYHDVLAWFVVWMAFGNIPSVSALMAPFSNVQSWAQRMGDIGNGKAVAVDSADAIAVAKAATPIDAPGVGDNPLGLTLGQSVAVFADDYGQDRICGELVGLTAKQISVRRHAERAGELHIHFPAIGYHVSPDD
ncbi:MAG: glutathione S-transferase family protein [Pseudomonadota bacterium]